LILAGGLDPSNIVEALSEALPDAVDVSSGVEFAPGRKDAEKVRRLLEATAHAFLPRKPKSIFR
jgi:phosphoribosylanthranilate isomerase